MALVLLAAGLVVGSVPASAQDEEPIVVSAVDFEDGTTGTWIPSGGNDNTLSVVPEPDGGGQVLSVNDRDADFVGIQSPTGIFEPGRAYTFEMRVRLAEGVEGEPGVRFVMKPAFEWIGNTTMTAADWTTVTGQWTAPGDGDPDELQVYIGTADLDGPYTYLVDDIVITTDGGDPPTAEPGIVFTTDFEDGTLGGWQQRFGAEDTEFSLDVTDTEAATGTFSALVSERDVTGDGIGYDMTGELIAGVTYNVSASVKFASDQEAGDVWLSLASTSGEDTSFATLGQFSGMSNSEWVPVEASFTMPAHDTALLYFETAFNGSNTSDLLVDDIVVEVPEPPVIEDLTPLHETVPFPMGVAIDNRETLGGASELLNLHFNQITPENHMKPEAWYDDDRNFRPHPQAVELMDFAAANDLALYGHVLIWHSQVPEWFFQDDAGNPLTDSEADQQVLRDRMQTHIFNVIEWLASYGEFGGGNPVVAFDVVNEVVSDSGEFEDGLRRSEWYRILGEEYLDLSFAYADEAFNDTFAADGADRPVTLFINDYNTEQGGKQDRYFALVERLLARGVPVDGVGHQFHLSLASPVATLDTALDRFQGMGVTQAVTELDVPTGTPESEALFIDQGYFYRDAFDIFRDHADDLFAVTVWGLTDGRSWRAANGGPLLFDDALQAKPAYYGAAGLDLPARQRTAISFAGTVDLDGDATGSLEWSKLPALPIADGTAFQTRWAADHLTVFVTADDATVDGSDGVDVEIDGTVYSLARDGSGDVPAEVTERDGGYDLVAHLPLSGAAEGGTIGLDVRVSDGGTTSGWNTPGELGTVTLREELSYLEVAETSAPPLVDGEIDPVWAAASTDAVTTDKAIEGTDGATATVSTLWADDTLYVLAEVADPVIDVSASDPWQQDSVEIFVDGGNFKNGSYRFDDTQIRISATNSVSFGTGDEAFQAGRLESATSTVDGGYVVEASVNLLEYGGVGTFHGLDFQVNDGTDGARTSIRNWADPSSLGFQSTARWGVGQLIGPGEPAEPVCSVDYRSYDSRFGLFVGQVRLTNLTDERLADGWELEWAFDAGQRVITSTTRIAQAGTDVTATGRWPIQAETSRQFLFLATWSGTNPEPTGFTLNGTACSVS